MSRLLVTGASGLLGLTLCLEAAARRTTVTGLTHGEPLHGVPFEVIPVELAQPGEFARAFEAARPDAVVHCAALAVIDACEQQPDLSRRLNAELPAEIAGVCARHSVPLAHISTDAVFDGLRGGYTELDTPHPQSRYAQDKAASEQGVAEAYPAAVVARVNFYGWSLSGRRSLAEFFYANLSEGKRVNGFTDVLFCPLLVNDLANLLLEMLSRGLSGLYHVLSRESQSKYAFGVALARKFGLDETLITPVSVAEGGLAARRSPNLTLRVEKLEAALGRALPGQAEGLERLTQLHASGYPARLKEIGR